MAKTRRTTIPRRPSESQVTWPARPLGGGLAGAPQLSVTPGDRGPLRPPESPTWYARAPWGRISLRPAWTSLGI